MGSIVALEPQARGGPSQGPTCRRSSGACRDLFRAFLQNKPKPGPSIGTARPS